MVVAVPVAVFPLLFSEDVQAKSLAVFSIDRREPDGKVQLVDVPDAQNRLAGYALALNSQNNNYETSLASDLVLQVRSVARDPAVADKRVRAGINEVVNRILTFEEREVPEDQDRLILVARSPVEVFYESPLVTLARMLSLAAGLLLILGAAILLLRHR